MSGQHLNQYILAIEASNPSATRDGGAGGLPGVAIGRIRMKDGDTRLEGGIFSEPLAAGTGHEDDLMPAIDRLFRRAGASPREIVRIAVSIGPGGFTALRVAVTVAKTLSLTTGAKCVGVPTAMVLASKAEDAPSPLAVLLAAKGDSAYATVLGTQFFDQLKRSGVIQQPAGRLVAAADIAGLGARSICADRFLPGAINQECKRLGIPILTPVFDVEACLRLGIRMNPAPTASLGPLYPREPEAVTKWRALHPDR